MTTSAICEHFKVISPNKEGDITCRCMSILIVLLAKLESICYTKFQEKVLN